MDSYTTLLMISATVICDLETQPNIVLLVADDLGEYFTYKLKLKIIREGFIYYWGSCSILQSGINDNK